MTLFFVNIKISFKLLTNARILEDCGDLLWNPTEVRNQYKIYLKEFLNV